MTIAAQVLLPAVFVAGLCIDRPHAHAGIAAPDCAMHHAAGDAAADPSHHASRHGGHGDAPVTGARFECRCPADVPPFVAAEGMVVLDLVVAPRPVAVARAVMIGDDRFADTRIAPSSPPPRAFPS